MASQLSLPEIQFEVSRIGVYFINADVVNNGWEVRTMVASNRLCGWPQSTGESLSARARLPKKKLHVPCVSVFGPAIVKLD